jgi:ribosomal protein L11 methyltransferase
VIARASGSVGAPLPPHELHEVADRDWVRATQSQFGPIAIGERLVIVPSWCEAPRGATAITLDPGLAFGTGSHPTTRLCLEWLQERLPPHASVLDYGCGSGVLAIAAMKLGAGEAVGTDVDPQAIRASTDNARANAVAASFVLPDRLDARAFDVVVANILANPLVLLAPALAARVRPAGRIALCGILDAQAPDVIAAYAPWFTLRAWRDCEGWVLLEGERPR